MEKYERAEADYIAGMKYSEIADKYGTTVNTVKSWKKRYDWKRNKDAPRNAPKKKKGCKQNKEGAAVRSDPIDDGTKDTLQNSDLTPEQRMFCVYYIRTFNATQSYLKAYKCSYDTANAEGYKALVKPCIKREIERLREIKHKMIIAEAEDIVELQMRIAFSDIGECLSFSGEEIHLNDSSEVDTQLIQEIRQGRRGVYVKMADRQKAIEWLSKYFLMHPEDKYKAEFDRRRVEPERPDDGETVPNSFIDALKGQAESIIAGAGEIIETENSIQI